LETVDGLRKGKTPAHDNPPISPVCNTIVAATLKHLSLTVAHMVQFQRLTGARPGEVCIIRPSDIEQLGDVWFYIPERHKTEHHGKNRAIAIGQRAQVVLTPYLNRDAFDYCFKPTEACADYCVCCSDDSWPITATT
jgi:integrase